MAIRRVKMEQVPVIFLVTLVTAFLFPPAVHGSPGTEGSTETRVAIGDARWTLNGRLSYRASQAEGLLMNVRRVNATFEDRHRPNFDAERNTDAFIAKIPDPVVYSTLKALATPKRDEIYFPPPESQGGWRKLDEPERSRRRASMDQAKLDGLKEWLLESDGRSFAAVVIRNGYIVLEVERGNSSKTDSRRVASVSKAICATVLAIAAGESVHGVWAKDSGRLFLPQ